MPRSRRPRKRYQPQALDTDPVHTAIALATVLQPRQRLDLIEPMQRALAGLRDGSGRDAAWCALADAMNVAERLAALGIASDRGPEIAAAQQALADVYQRQQQRGSWTLRAAELAALDFGCILHRIQLEHCTQGEIRTAIQTVQRCVAAALAGNAPRDALVCVGRLSAPGAPTGPTGPINPQAATA